MTGGALLRACVLLLLLPPGQDPGGQSRAKAGSGFSPALNWVLPLFTKEGFRSMILRGDKVYSAGPDRIDVENLWIAVYSGDRAQRVTGVLMSPAASYYPRENRAGGSGAVRLIRDDGEISGEDWTYGRAGEKVSIRRNARVTFREELADMLK